MEKQESRIALRLPLKQRQQIDKLIQEGKAESVSDVVRKALEAFFSKN